MMAESLVFYTISFLIVVSAAFVIFCRKPVHSAVFLIFCFVSIAAMYIHLDAEFIAAIQILVYAGGIMVLFLFMIMLVSMRELEKMQRFHRQAVVGVITAILVLAFAGHFIANSDLRDQAPGNIVSENLMARTLDGSPVRDKIKSNDISGNVEAVANELFYSYIFPFELASVYLLAAMVGAIVLAKREEE